MGNSGEGSRRGILAAFALLLVGLAKGGQEAILAIRLTLRSIYEIGSQDNEEERYSGDRFSSGDEIRDSPNNGSQDWQTAEDLDDDQPDSGDILDDEDSIDSDDINEHTLYDPQDINYVGHLDSGMYRYWKLDVTHRDSTDSPLFMWYSISVYSGPDIDMFLLKKEEFQAFDRGDRFWNSLASETGFQSASGLERIQDGVFYLVIDNSEMGATNPAGETPADAHFSLEVDFFG